MSQQTEIVRTLTVDFNLPLAIVARYRPEHPFMSHFVDEETLGAGTAGGTIHMAVNSGPLATELCELAYRENFLLQGSSANPTGTGNKFRVEDVPDEIRDIVDLVVDYGLAKWWIHGLGLTILDFKGSEVEVLRIGACYETIKDLLQRFWNVTLPDDPGRESVPHGNLKDLPPSEALKKLVDDREKKSS